MVFRLTTIYPDNNKAKAHIITWARRTIILYDYGVKEKQLDLYFRENYKRSLRSMCLYLLSNCTVSTDTQGTIITFPTDNLNNIAKLITYGNGKCYGSNILRAALC